MQFYTLEGAWGKEDHKAAFKSVARFRPTPGFSAGDATGAEYVTIMGGRLRIGREAAERLRQSGYRVRRFASISAEETEQPLNEIAAPGDELDGF